MPAKKHLTLVLVRHEGKIEQMYSDDATGEFDVEVYVVDASWIPPGGGPPMLSDKNPPALLGKPDHQRAIYVQAVKRAAAGKPRVK